MDNVTYTITPNKKTYLDGENVVIKFVLAEKYRIANVVVNGGVVFRNSTYTINGIILKLSVITTISLYINFVINTYALEQCDGVVVFGCEFL